MAKNRITIKLPRRKKRGEQERKVEDRFKHKATKTNNSQKE